MKTGSAALFLFLAATSTNVVAFLQPTAFQSRSMGISLKASSNDDNNNSNSSEKISRRGAFAKAVSGAVTAASVAGVLNSGMRPEPANAIGPVKINLLNPTYTAVPCPKDRPIPGEKAMKGMRGLCVTVDVDLEDLPDRAMDKVGVYGYITDKGTGESVLANNPDLSTDAGQFAIIPKIETTAKKTQFEFIAAVPSEIVRARRV